MTVLEDVAEAFKDAGNAATPPGVSVVDYDETPADANRYVQQDVTPIYSRDGTSTQRRMNDRYRVVDVVIADTVTNARVYVTNLFAAYNRKRLEVGTSLLTGEIKHEDTTPITYEDDLYRCVVTWNFTLGAKP